MTSPAAPPNTYFVFLLIFLNTEFEIYEFIKKKLKSTLKSYSKMTTFFNERRKNTKSV